MKKTKWDYLLEMLKEILDYFDNHKIQGRILFTGVSASLIILSIKFITDDLIKIIEVLK